jgi:signal peptidase I
MKFFPSKRNREQPAANQNTPGRVSLSPPAGSAVEHDTSPGRFHNLLSTAGLFLSAFLIAVLLNSFVIQSYQVDGQSMVPTLQNNDRLIVNKVPRTISRVDGHQYVPHRGDIIIFNQDGLPGFIGSKQLIKRVIGLPGEHVVVSGGKITVYNAQHPEGFNPDTTGQYHISAPRTNGDFDNYLTKDELFVCGDNRPFSEDSRFFGPIKTNQVVAKLVLRILPVNNTRSF